LLSQVVRNDMVVMDVGANVGLYTGLFSKLVGPMGRVIAVEPNALNWIALQTAMSRNGWSNVESYRCALHDRRDSLLLVDNPCNSGNHAISMCPSKGSRGVATVEARSLDEVVNGRRVDFIKIDVQGWEFKVLQGARETLAKDHPLTLLVELWPYGLHRNGVKANDIINLLKRFSFRLVDPWTGKPFVAAPSTGYTDVLAVRN